MATVVQFGAGAIGRGFLAQFWSEAGYEIVFVDVDVGLCEALNRERAYTLALVTNETRQEIEISPVRAIHTENVDEVLAALAECAFAAVSIGPHVVETVETFFVPCMVGGEEVRRTTPLNVIVAENDPLASEHLTELFTKGAEACGASAPLDIAFVQAIIGRMVPRPEGPDLTVTAEPYKLLPLEAGRWLGNFPQIPQMLEQPNFHKYVEKKLYIHNAGHAALAYHGYRFGHESIYECAGDDRVVAEVRGFWNEVNAVLQGEALPLAVLTAFEDDLLRRFCNSHLGDTVVRVGRDPIRKLNRNDRLVHPAIAYFEKIGQSPVHMVRAIAAALRFDYPEDPSAVHLQELIQEKGVRDAFLEISHYEAGDPDGLVSQIEEAYNALDAA